MAEYSKKRNTQHRIDTDGIKLFREALPSTKEIDFVFDESKSDYGIDGELQIFLDEKSTGEFYKVQIKSKQKAKFIQKAKYLSLSLDIESAYFLTNTAKSATALVVPDLDSKKVFWHPVQTDDKLRNDIESDPGRKSVTIHIDTANELRADNCQKFYNYLKDASTKLSQKAILDDKTNPTLHAGLAFLSEYEEKKLQLDGFTSHIRSPKASPTPGTVFSIGAGARSIVDYVPSSDFRPELTPKIKVKTKFDTKTSEGKKRAEALKRILAGGEGSIELSGENIELFSATSGEKIIGDTDGLGSVSLTIGNVIQKRQHKLFIDNGHTEIINEVESWVQDGKIHIESIENQYLKINTVIDPNVGSNSTFNIKANSSSFKGVAQELSYINFIRSLKTIGISISDSDGFKVKMFDGAINSVDKSETDARYNFIKALAEIEQTTGVPVLYPLPETISEEEVKNVYWVHRLVTKGVIKQNMSINFVLKDGYRPDQFKTGGVLAVTYDPPELDLLGRPYILKGYAQRIVGTIGKITTLKKEDNDTSYRAEVRQAEIMLQRKSEKGKDDRKN